MNWGDIPSQGFVMRGEAGGKGEARQKGRQEEAVRAECGRGAGLDGGGGGQGHGVKASGRPIGEILYRLMLPPMSHSLEWGPDEKLMQIEAMG